MRSSFLETQVKLRGTRCFISIWLPAFKGKVDQQAKVEITTSGEPVQAMKTSYPLLMVKENNNAFPT
jgi:hypothetical protein